MTFEDMKKDFNRRGTVYGSEMRKDPLQKFVIQNYGDVQNHKVSDQSLLMHKESNIEHADDNLDNDLNEEANPYLSYN